MSENPTDGSVAARIEIADREFAALDTRSWLRVREMLHFDAPGVVQTQDPCRMVTVYEGDMSSTVRTVLSAVAQNHEVEAVLDALKVHRFALGGMVGHV